MSKPLAILTGAASGIGHAVAQHLSKTHTLVLIDRAEIPAHPEGEKLQVDVSSQTDWKKVSGAIKGRPIDFVLLNAGIGPNPSWTDVEGWHTLMNTNMFGVVNGIATLLPHIENTKATVVITGSKQGITNPPGNPAYNASKAALKIIAENLSYSLRSSQVSVHLLVPGYTYTGLTKQSSSKPDAAWTAEQVSDYLFKKLEHKQFYVICPDNAVTTEMDNKRMLWNVKDITEGRPALSRWREEYEQEFASYMK